MSLKKCPIWGTPASVVITDSWSGHSGDGVVNPPEEYEYSISSARAGGLYMIDGGLWDYDGGPFSAGDMLNKIRSLNISSKTRLTNWLVDQRRSGVESPNINDAIIGYVEKVTISNAIDKAESVLSFLCRESQYLGSPIIIKFGSDEETLLHILAETGCSSEFELLHLVEYLEQKSLVFTKGKSKKIVVTVDGHERISAIGKNISRSNQAFVAMWFSPEVEDAYNSGIEPAILNCGFDPLRIDRKETVNKIDDEIISEIKKSKFLIADFTSPTNDSRGGVYYEAGFAHGIGIPVIFTCRSDKIDQVHFDTRQYNHILWSNAAELRVALERRIAAIIT